MRAFSRVLPTLHFSRLYRLFIFIFIFLSMVKSVAASVPSGYLDRGFDPGFGVGINESVHTILLQPDGNSLIGGTFLHYNGSTRRYVARILAGGGLDPDFNPSGWPNDVVNTLGWQPDGKVMIGGNFTEVDGHPRNRIARLNADGSLDPIFDPGSGADNAISSLALQPDGKILIAGAFTQFNGTAINRIARLNRDGSLDSAFSIGNGPDEQVTTVTLQPDGKILIAGLFNSFNGIARSRLARLNTDGSLDAGFDPGGGPDGIVGSIKLNGQPDGKVLIAGAFSSFNGTPRRSIARLNGDGSLDAGFNPGAGALGIIVSMALQSDGRILIGGTFTAFNGISRSKIARLHPNGALDLTFDPAAGPDNAILALAQAPGGKVLLGGDFRTFNGVSRGGLARVNVDGSLDVPFNPGSGADGVVRALIRQEDGKILIGGAFQDFNGSSLKRIARLNADGFVDPSFNPGSGADSTVRALALQPDFKVLIGGFFTHFNGTSRNRIARLEATGSLDVSFNPGGGANGPVAALALQPDGKVLLGGGFTDINGTGRNRIARLTSTGSLDLTFDPGTGGDGQVLALAVQPDGKILLGGLFTGYKGVSRRGVARVNPDGSLDSDFDPGGGVNAGTGVQTLALQPDGKVLVGGDFTFFNGTARGRIARLNPDGSLDPGFDPGTGADGTVHTLTLQPDGRIVIGGSFINYNGIPRRRIARLEPDGSLDVSFNSAGGADGPVYASALQPEGKVLIGGDFTTYSQLIVTNIYRLARLNGAKPPVFTIPPPPTMLHAGRVFNYNFRADAYPRNFFYVSEGELPPGLSLNGFFGTLSGTPTKPGTYTCEITAANFNAPSAEQVVTLTVENFETYLPLLFRN